MTQLNFWLANHNKTGQRSLEDVIGIFGHQLRALGHKAVWDPSNKYLLPKDSGINVVVEGFSPASAKIIADAHAQGCRFLCLATEEPTPDGFNHGRDPEMVKRQAIFPEVAKYFDGILHLVPGDHVTAWYSELRPAAYLELGFAPSLERKPERFGPEPEYDFGFFGTLSERRLRILKRLQKRSRGKIKIVADFASQGDRDREMRRARVILQIRKHEEMGLVSSSRCNTALHLGRPVVAEPHLLSKPWDEVVRFADTMDGFYDLAMMVRATWRGTHEDQMARFKAKMGPEVCVGEPLRRIGIGLTSGLAAA